MSSAVQLVSSSKHFGGSLAKYTHKSEVNNCTMTFNIFLPAAAVAGERVPVLYCLGGLSSTEDNFALKAGAANRASKYNLALVFPDTSPRDVPVPDAGKDGSLGYSAGFYVDATQAPWAEYWNMYSYISKELPAVVEANFPIDGTRASITGHSMGGHGALTIFLKNQEQYRSVSAFAPICHPTKADWGVKAFDNYLGSQDRSTWSQYDTVELLKKVAEEKSFRNDIKVLIDQGTGDGYLNNGLNTYDLIKTVKDTGLESQFEIRFQDGYDHGYFFISTFAADHIDHHAKALGLNQMKG